MYQKVKTIKTRQYSLVSLFSSENTKNMNPQTNLSLFPQKQLYFFSIQSFNNIQIKQMIDQLIKQQAQFLDYLIICQVPQLQSYFDPDIFYSDQTLQSSTQELGAQYSDGGVMQEQSHTQLAKESSANTQETKTKTKPIKQRPRENQSQDFSEFVIIKMKPSQRKKRGAKPKGYPTKNFLQNFKSPHFEFLENFLGKDYVMSFQEVKHIKEKKGISLKDYERLYKVPEFQTAFEQFFTSKVLYRQLLTSRSILSVKKIHQRKLYVFEEAFRSKKFQKIN